MYYELIRLVKEPFNPSEAIEETSRSLPKVGGVASFTGIVRTDGAVEALELSYYEPLTLSGMEDIGGEACVRFDLESITIIHRVGNMQPGEPIVCVAAAAQHRRGAIDAVDFCMDHLKSAAWFWKREKRAGVWHWIEPRAEDYADLARWAE